MCILPHWGIRKFEKRAAVAALFAFLMFGFPGLPDGHYVTQLRAEDGGAVHREEIEIIGPQTRLSFDVEIARTPEEQARGLMFRRSIKPGHGMLFLYPSPQEITMWMQNTYISLDMVFVKADGSVLRVARETEPFSETLIYSTGDVTGVLEIGAGEADRLGIRAGDRIHHPHFGN